MKKVLLAALLTWTSSAHAYLALLSTGDVLEKNQFSVLGYIEGVFDEFDGVNVNARGSVGLSEDLQADLEIGAGEFEIMVGGFLKWVPIPDYEKQPAIGVRGGVTYINWDMDRGGDYSETSVVAMPFASKAFELEQQGRLVPYLGMPLGLRSNSNDTDFTARLVLGSEWTHQDMPELHLIGEIGLELSESFGSATIGASYKF